MPDRNHIFFDLDHTLWDFDSNSTEALEELYHELELIARGIPTFDVFMERYRHHNDILWSEYRLDRVTKEVLRVERFNRAFSEFGFRDDELAERLATRYLSVSPRKKNLFPGATEVLKYLGANYSLHIITNGFEEVQSIKMRETGLDAHFDLVITSEMAGCRKPDEKIFRYALELAGAMAESSIMIGDKPDVDLDVPKKLGMRTFHFSPAGVHGESGGHDRFEELIELKLHL